MSGRNYKRVGPAAETSWFVRLPCPISFDAITNKISLIKAVRACTFAGLKEAKDMVESPIPVFLEFPSRDEAKAAHQTLKPWAPGIIMTRRRS